MSEEEIREGKGKRPEDPERVRNRLAGLCARSEQCSFDLLRKMRTAGLTEQQSRRILSELEELQFVDDRRFAQCYARDKVRFSAWGNRKIRLNLAAKNIPGDIIDEALAAVDPKDYKEALIRAARAKLKGLDISQPEQYAKLIQGIMSRGFEGKYVAQIASQLLKRYLQ